MKKKCKNLRRNQDVLKEERASKDKSLGIRTLWKKRKEESFGAEKNKGFYCPFSSGTAIIKDKRFGGGFERKGMQVRGEVMK